MFQINAPWSDLQRLFRYINEAFGLSCLPDLMEHKIYPNAKELTESMAAYDVARNKVPVFDLGDPEVTMIAVADGRSPRTAAMFAFRTAWQCASVDPNLKVKESYNRIRRLTLYPVRIEEFPASHYKKLFIAAVHSHAPLDVVCDRLTADLRVVMAMPCCVAQERERPPDLEYYDFGVWSPKNKIRVWVDGDVSW